MKRSSRDVQGENKPLRENTEQINQFSLNLPESILATLKQQENWQQILEEEIINKLKQSQNSENILDRERYFQMIAEATPMPVIIASVKDGKISYVNAITQDILNLSIPEILNCYLKDLFENPQEVKQLLTRTLQEKLIQNQQFRWRKPDGKIIWVSVSAQLFQYQENSAILCACCNITACKELELALAEKEAFLQLVLDNIPQLIFWKDTNRLFVGCNRLWANAAGLENLDEVKGKTDEEIYHAPNNRHKYPPYKALSYYREQDLRVLETGESELHHLEHKKDSNGQEVWYDTHKIPIKNTEGEIVGILGTIENITSRKLAERALFQEKELAQVTLQSIGEGVICLDAVGNIENMNSVAENLTGWSLAEAKGKTLATVFSLVNETNYQTENNLIERVLQAEKTIRWKNSLLLRSKNKKQYSLDITASPIYCREGTLIGIVIVFSDQTQSRQLTQKLSWQASHDSLTKLVNREKFEQLLGEAVYTAKRDNLEHTLCYLDLDQFKIINDTCGHIAGDDLLRQVSALLNKRIRSTDTIGRLGGDEFGLLLQNCSLEESAKIVNILRDLIEKFRFVWEQKTFKIGVSIGLVVINSESEDITTLLSLADSACYAAKNRGGNNIYVYNKNDEEIAKQRSERYWVARINQALDENRFCLYMQKIVPVSSKFRTIHYEILLRLLDEQGNIIAPNNFLPAAERYNLIHKIDQWVIENFFDRYEVDCQQNLYLNKNQNCNFYTINLSGKSLNNEDFIQFLKEQLVRPYIFPSNICFEITETAAIANLSQTQQLITSLKNLGCRFALDDFGTGMSSLAYLKYLPVDYLKIDGEFVKNLANDSINYTLVECFNRMGHVLGMHTIAEYVENDSILNGIKTIGIDYAQGYGISRPIPFSLE